MVVGVSVSRTATGLGWPLRTVEDMFSALSELAALGWTGAVECDEVSGWKLRLSQSGQNTVNAELWQWLTLLGAELSVVGCEQFSVVGYETDGVVVFPDRPVVVDESAADEPVVPFGSQTSPDMSARIVR